MSTTTEFQAVAGRKAIRP